MMPQRPAAQPRVIFRIIANRPMRPRRSSAAAAVSRHPVIAVGARLERFVHERHCAGRRFFAESKARRSAAIASICWPNARCASDSTIRKGKSPSHPSAGSMPTTLDAPRSLAFLVWLELGEPWHENAQPPSVPNCSTVECTGANHRRCRRRREQASDQTR